MPRKARDIPRECLTFGRELGHGEFGVVKHAFLLLDDASTPGSALSAAVKMCKEGASSAMIKEFELEGQRLHALNHANVVKLLGTNMSAEPYLLVFEYMSNGDLRHLLRRSQASRITLNATHLVKLAMDVSRGFAYLQRMRFVHRDLAARNVLVGGDFVAKIGDLGSNSWMGSLFKAVVHFRH